MYPLNLNVRLYWWFVLDICVFMVEVLNSVRLSEYNKNGYGSAIISYGTEKCLIQFSLQQGGTRIPSGMILLNEVSGKGSSVIPIPS